MTQASGDAAALVESASSGNDAALQDLLGLLANSAGQRAAIAALLDSGDARLWSRLLHFAAHGAMPATAAPTAARAGTPNARNAVAVAFAARRGTSGDAGRHQALTEAVSSSDALVRAFGIELLGRRGDDEALPLITAALNDADDRVRVAAVRALASQPPEAAIPLLLRALEQFDVVSGEAVNSLIRVGPAAVPVLIQELQNRNSWARWHAARALGGIHDPQSIVPLIDALTDDDAGVRWESVHALSGFGEQVIDPLLRAVTIHTITPWFAEGVDRVLNRVATGELHQPLANLQRMLHHLDAAVEAPVEAARVRQALRSQG